MKSGKKGAKTGGESDGWLDKSRELGTYEEQRATLVDRKFRVGVS